MLICCDCGMFSTSCAKWRRCWSDWKACRVLWLVTVVLSGTQILWSRWTTPSESTLRPAKLKSSSNLTPVTDVICCCDASACIMIERQISLAYDVSFSASFLPSGHGFGYLWCYLSSSSLHSLLTDMESWGIREKWHDRSWINTKETRKCTRAKVVKNLPVMERWGGCSGVVVEYRTRNKRLRVRLTPGLLQATLSKLLAYCVLRPTQPPTLGN